MMRSILRFFVVLRCETPQNDAFLAEMKRGYL